MKIDMHVHTHYSHDSNMKPEELISAARARALDAVCVVDHRTTEGALECVERAKGTDLLVIPGQEVRTLEGEIIALGITKDIENDMSLLETCESIKKQSGFIIVPHPFDKFRSGIGNSINNILNYVDAIEVFNSRILFGKFNQKAAEIARKNNIPAVAGSDAHFPNEIGNAYMILECEKSEQAIFRAIREGRARLVTNKTGLRRYPKTLALKIKKKIKKKLRDQR